MSTESVLLYLQWTSCLSIWQNDLLMIMFYLVAISLLSVDIQSYYVSVLGCLQIGLLELLHVVNSGYGITISVFEINRQL